MAGGVLYVIDLSSMRFGAIRSISVLGVSCPNGGRAQSMKNFYCSRLLEVRLILCKAVFIPHTSTGHIHRRWDVNTHKQGEHIYLGSAHDKIFP